MNVISTRTVSSFEDAAVTPELWSTLLAQGDTRAGIMTWQSQRLWWEEHQHLGQLALIVAFRDGEPKAIAPMFVVAGMAMNLCPVNTLDFIGDISDSALLDAILLAAIRSTGNFVGLRFHFVPDTSRTGRFLQDAAERLGLKAFLEDDQLSPVIDIRGKPEHALACTRKKTMLRRENQLRREGTLEVFHFRDAINVLPQLDLFFDQHVGRWSDTATPSKFRDVKARESFRRRTEELAHAGWLRFSRLDWENRPVAFHRGTCYQGHYKYGRTSYAKEIAEYSPGTVLLRHVLLEAITEGAHTFDFGIGGEAYKYRYATDLVNVQTWGLYPVTA